MFKKTPRVVFISFAFLFGIVSCNSTVSFAQTANGASKPKFTAYLRTELFFGMDKPSGGQVTQQEWEKFVEEVITPRFPDGLTVDDAQGQYFDGKTLVREKSKQLILLYPRRIRSLANRKIEQIRAAYIKAFDQRSVLRVDLPTYVLVSF